MRKWTTSGFALAVLTLAGCASQQATLTVYTNPSAATISDDSGGAQAVSPMTYRYDLAAPDQCLVVRGFTATWLSGATAHTAQTLRLCGVRDYNVTIQRPANVAGVEYDIEQAAQRERIEREARERAAKAWGDAAETWGAVLGRTLK